MASEWRTNRQRMSSEWSVTADCLTWSSLLKLATANGYITASALLQSSEWPSKAANTLTVHCGGSTVISRLTTIFLITPDHAEIIEANLFSQDSLSNGVLFKLEQHLFSALIWFYALRSTLSLFKASNYCFDCCSIRLLNSTFSLDSALAVALISIVIAWQFIQN